MEDELHHLFHLSQEDKVKLWNSAHPKIEKEQFGVVLPPNASHIASEIAARNIQTPLVLLNITPSKATKEILARHLKQVSTDLFATVTMTTPKKKKKKR